MRTVLTEITAVSRTAAAVGAIASAALAAVWVFSITPVAFAQGTVPCPARAGRNIEPTLIGLPSGSARIVSATVERFQGSPTAPEPAYSAWHSSLAFNGFDLRLGERFAAAVQTAPPKERAVLTRSTFL
jgi:hypothetical protein